jgi:L-glutamine-phosphate cytidylyltransferase
MKFIILAAGEGTRLRPYTETMPKCMVPFKEKPIISHILDVSNNFKFDKSCLLTGYKSEVLREFIKKNHSEKNIFFEHNPEYGKTNMVATLFCAKDFLEGDVIISYSDIIYTENVLKKLYEAEGDICVVVDKDWKKLWKTRMENPLSDAETMKIDSDGFIKELGKKPSSYEDIEGQYIGLIKISGSVMNKIKTFYQDLDKNKTYDGKDYKNIYLTSFLQLLIDSGFKLSPVFIEGGWVEIDSVEDLEKLKNYEI